MKRFKVSQIGGLVWVLVLILSGCEDKASSGVDPKPQSIAVKQVKTSRVEASVAGDDIQYVGTLVADCKVKVSSELGGTIEHLYFERGDQLEKGQLLAEISTSTIALQVNQAEAAVDAARSRLNKLKTGSRPQEIEIARAQVAEAEAALFEAEKNHERVSRLHKIGAVSNSGYDTARRQLSTAQAKVASAKQQLVLALEGPRQEDVSAAQAQLKESEAALALARDRLKKSRPHSPTAGIAAYRHVEPGEVIPAGAIITEVVDLSRMKIRFAIGEKDICLLNPDQEYTFMVDAVPEEEFQATLCFRSPTADSTTHSFPVELLVKRPDQGMADGMTVRVRLPVVGREKRIKVPSAWLAEHHGKMGLFVVRDQKAVFRPVTLGAYYDQRVEILEGLQGVSRVITNPAGLTDGEAVRVVGTQDAGHGRSLTE
ncbi:MAG: efflux RND transporter periplasmic adaptor subunit [Deltaproteobacteria bacterium]|nr:efflux RND transporter periplasmic adaptor subunit [Deltaproteobacteria bacterium]MCF8118695.1 efflux RND transporter periplasmic adaptor subunit [Deltaproteobacteria bacterium]